MQTFSTKGHISAKKGFTLVELLIVIGILAVLATTAVVILNPAQLLAQARDSQRLGDLGSIQAALALYLTDVGTVDLDDGGSRCKDQLTGGSATSGNIAFTYGSAAPTNGSFLGSTTAPLATTGNIPSTSRSTGDGAAGGTQGWIPVDLASIGSGSPLATYPIDPTNNPTTNFVYRYACDQTSKTFELNACLESDKYKPQMGSDGGDKPTGAYNGTDACGSANYYEVGTDPGLNL